MNRIVLIVAVAAAITLPAAASAAIFWQEPTYDAIETTTFPPTFGQTFGDFGGDDVTLGSVAVRIAQTEACPSGQTAVFNAGLDEVSSYDDTGGNWTSTQAFAYDPSGDLDPEIIETYGFVPLSQNYAIGVTSYQLFPYPSYLLDHTKKYRLWFDTQCWINEEPTQNFGADLIMGYASDGVLGKRQHAGIEQWVNYPTGTFSVILDSAGGMHETPIIESPPDGAKITELPVVFTGTCDATLPWVNIEIREGGTLEMLKTIYCTDIGTFDTSDDGAQLWNGTGFSATAASFNNEGTIRVIGDPVGFYVDVLGNPNVRPTMPPVPPEDCANADTITEQATCWITQRLHEMMIALFQPPAGSMDRFRNLWEAVKNKPPVGYVVVTANTINTLTIGTPSVQLQGIAALSNFFDPMKTLLTTALWLFALVWLFNRAREIEV